MSGFLSRILSFFRGGSGKKQPAAASGTRAPAYAASATPSAGAAASRGKPAAASKDSAEARCGITPGMGEEEIRGILAKLYKRYNQAAGSLNSEMQKEAEQMLSAIVECREKHLGR